MFGDASINYDIIGSGNGMSPVRRHAIIWTNGDISPIGPPGKMWTLDLSTKLFFNKNVFEYVVCEMMTILSRSWCVKSRDNLVSWYVAALTAS